jgi:hypothetical protein
MKYSTPPRLSRMQATADLASADSRKCVDALLSLALYDSDWRWVQDQCPRLLADPEEDVSQRRFWAWATLPGCTTDLTSTGYYHA